MDNNQRPTRVLYSFPHKLGADRICYTAWHQVNGLARAGGEVTVFPGVLHKPVATGVHVRPTLSRGRLRISYKLLGTKRACALHDWIVSRRMRKLVGKIDIVHAWPMGARRTLKVANSLGIPTVLERPNAHTRFAYEVVREECVRLGLEMPKGHEHAFKSDWLAIEEEEYSLATNLLCPSEFVAKTFVDAGFAEGRLSRHQYGFDEELFHPGRPASPDRPFTMLFAGGCAPRKGLHYALQAWLRSPASKSGKFLVAGEFIPNYREHLAEMLAHPSVQVLGFCRNVPDLMRDSDVFVLPTIEEGSALVTSEARGCGCVLLVSEAAGANFVDGEHGFSHKVRDVDALAEQITMLYQNRELLARMRAASLSTISDITWKKAGERLLNVYEEVVSAARAAKNGTL